MSERTERIPPLPSLVAGSVVAVGVLLYMFAGKQFLFVAGLGAFGPGILRELGWLRDHDEFQRQAARRAGYHAYLVGGLATAVVVSLLHATGETPRFPDEVLTWVVVVMWMTWLFSSMLSFWDGVRTTTVVLGAFGAFWAVFVAADIIGGLISGGLPSVGDALMGTGAAILILTPFFGIPYLARRRPRFAGWLLLAASATMAVVFLRPSALEWSTQLMTFTLLDVPLMACGIALLLGGEREPDESTA